MIEFSAGKAMCDLCVAKVKALSAKNYAKNKERVLAKNARWVLENKERSQEIKRRWYKSNPAYNAAKTAKRRAIPAWGNPEKIKEFYAAADFLGMVTGEWYHVDHIVPLNSPLVCGLHTEQNLQVLPASDNLRKSNRRWPDMP